jgi:hypothetical protein
MCTLNILDDISAHPIIINDSKGQEEVNRGVGSRGRRREGTRRVRTGNSNRGYNEEIIIRMEGLVYIRGGSWVVGFVYDNGY